HGFQCLAGAGVVATVFLQCLLGLVEQGAQMVEAFGSEHRIEGAIVLVVIVIGIIGVVVVLGFGFFCLGLGALGEGRLTVAGGGGGAVIVRVKVAGNDVGETTLFEGNLVEFADHEVDGARPE